VPASASITCDIELRLVVSGQGSVPVPAMLRYDVSDPYAIAITFSTGPGGDVRWVFARDLMADGLERPTGDGDVVVWPSESEGREVVYVSLSSPEGQALFEGPRRPVAAFVHQTYGLVPRGLESRFIDVDAALERLLDSPEIA
jgi:hypothetical protein